MGGELSDPRSARGKRLRQLTKRTHRAETGQFLAEGAHAVQEALAAHVEGRATVHELILGPDAAAANAELAAMAASLNVALTNASDAVVAALSETVTPQGILAVVDVVDVPLATLVSHSPTLVAVLADVRDPGNAGATLRVADAAGASGVVFAGDSVDPYNGKVIRSSAGGLFHLTVVARTSVVETLETLGTAGLQIVVADGHGEHDLDSPDTRDMLSVPTAWVFGNEAWGVPEPVAAMAEAVVRVPIYGKAESLNVATAAALCLYATARSQKAKQAESGH